MSRAGYRIYAVGRSRNALPYAEVDTPAQLRTHLIVLVPPPIDGLILNGGSLNSGARPM